MPTTDTPIGDYAWIGDQRTGALISREGSIDWMCLPRFDSPAAFCALLGDEDNGYWELSIAGGEVISRAYEEGTMVLRTMWRTPEGEAVVTDFMPMDMGCSDIARIVECTSGRVQVKQHLVIRFDYGQVVPWVRRLRGVSLPTMVAVAGPYQLVLQGPPLTPGRGKRHTGTFSLAKGESASWVLTARDSWEPVPEPLDLDKELHRTRAEWRDWWDQIEADGPYAEQVRRSLLVLRSLTDAQSGGIVAAPTTSLPEDFGGERNWDYRYCWLRDSALTLQALISHGFSTGALAWRDWLLRAVAGDPQDLQIMYGVGGERHLAERELTHLAGYASSRPVRIGNGAVMQYQADVVGEVMLALGALRDLTDTEDRFAWSLQCMLLSYLEDRFEDKDYGIWEMRGDPHYFTHGRVMMWAAFDQGVRAVTEHGLSGPADRWRELRDRLHEEIWSHGFDSKSGSFTQTYDSSAVDASLLQLPHTGFVDYRDPAMLSTVRRIEAELVDPHGLVHRYRADGTDGLGGEEAPFVVCSFWLVEQYAHGGRLEQARQLMETLVGAVSDVGLLAEEYDASLQRHVGNYPQAFSHLGLVRAADAIAKAQQAMAQQRPGSQLGAHN